MTDDFHPRSLDASISRLNTIADRVEKRLDDGEKEFKELRKDVESLKAWRKYTIGIAVGAGLLMRAAWEWFLNQGGSGKH